MAISNFLSSPRTGDIAEDSNLNRLIGAYENDPVRGTRKTEIAKRLIKGLWGNAVVEAYSCRWQDNPEPLRGCDIIFGCVDGFAQRRELEACARRYLIPLIDVGMDVHCVDDDPARMGGQVILSIPGGPCMFCLGFLNERVLAQEGRYEFVCWDGARVCEELFNHPSVMEQFFPDDFRRTHRLMNKDDVDSFITQYGGKDVEQLKAALSDVMSTTKPKAGTTLQIADPGHSSLGAVVAIFYALSECNEVRAQGRILANQRMNVVGEFLGTLAGIKGTPGIEGTRSTHGKRLKRKQVVV